MGGYVEELGRESGEGSLREGNMGADKAMEEKGGTGLKNVASACRHCGLASREVWLGHGVLGHGVRAKPEETDWLLRTLHVPTTL